MPVLIFFAVLDLRQISADFENPHFWTDTNCGYLESPNNFFVVYLIGSPF